MRSMVELMSHCELNSWISELLNLNRNLYAGVVIFIVILHKSIYLFHRLIICTLTSLKQIKLSQNFIYYILY